MLETFGLEITNMGKFKKETLATFGLIIVAVFWGLGFPALKFISDSIPTFYLIGMRFLIASLFLGLFFFKKLKEISKSLVRDSFILSVLLFLTYIFATLGIRYTTSAKASFFSCLGVLMIPFISRIIDKVKIHKKVSVSLVICAVGLFLISYTKGMGFGLSIGDIICAGCSFWGASHVVATGKLTHNQDPILLTTVQLFFISIWGFLIGFFVEDFPAYIPVSHLGVLVFLAVFCTALAFLLQTSCQRYIPPTRTGFILAVEPVIGAIASTILLGDRLGLYGIIGGILIFFSIAYMESAKIDIFGILAKLRYTIKKHL